MKYPNNNKYREIIIDKNNHDKLFLFVFSNYKIVIGWLYVTYDCSENEFYIIPADKYALNAQLSNDNLLKSNMLYRSFNIDKVQNMIEINQIQNTIDIIRQINQK